MTQSSTQLRKNLLERRRGISPEALGEIGAAAVARFQSALAEQTGILLQGLCVALYRAMKDEVSLDSLDTWFRERGARIFFPRICDREAKVLEFVEVPEALDSSFQEGPYSLSEPHSELKASEISTLQMIFVPGAGFGARGERIGLGAGYYDRALVQAPRALRVALTADALVEDSLPQNSWDQPVHWIVTEKREIRMNTADAWIAEQRRA